MEVEPGWGLGGTRRGVEAPAAEPWWSCRCWSWWGGVGSLTVHALLSHCVLSGSWVVLLLLPRSSEVTSAGFVYKCVCVACVAFCIFFLPLSQICDPKWPTMPCGLVLLSTSMSFVCSQYFITHFLFLNCATVFFRVNHKAKWRACVAINSFWFWFNVEIFLFFSDESRWK